MQRATQTSGNLVAKYWYDAENRRIRKEVAQEDTIVNYFLDGMNEIQESGACTGVVLHQWVHGPMLDELLVQDYPLPPWLADVASHCVMEPANVSTSDQMVCANAGYGTLLFGGTPPCTGPCTEALFAGISPDPVPNTGLLKATTKCTPCLDMVTGQLNGGTRPSNRTLFGV
ncbi:MAG: hypothetical protein LC620_07605 [Halobacteriales archaeon]|nr:hypothetical protein [Halobacteriales archaeon]